MGLFAGGIAEESYPPAFHVTRETRGCLEQTLELANVAEYRTEHADDGGRAIEIRPTTDQTTLGRLLVALGAPQGQKGEGRRFGLPCYLGPAPDAVRRRFVAIYLLNRASDSEGVPGLEITEKRPAAYLEALAGLIRSVTTADVRVTERNRICIERAVLSDVDVPKKWHSEVS